MKVIHAVTNFVYIFQGGGDGGQELPGFTYKPLFETMSELIVERERERERVPSSLNIMSHIPS